MSRKRNIRRNYSKVKRRYVDIHSAANCGCKVCLCPVIWCSITMTVIMLRIAEGSPLLIVNHCTACFSLLCHSVIIKSNPVTEVSFIIKWKRSSQLNYFCWCVEKSVYNKGVLWFYSVFPRMSRIRTSRDATKERVLEILLIPVNFSLLPTLVCFFSTVKGR